MLEKIIEPISQNKYQLADLISSEGGASGIFSTKNEKDIAIKKIIYIPNDKNSMKSSKRIQREILLMR